MRSERIEKLAVVGFLLIAFFCAVADFYFARATPINSDNVQNFNELRPIFNGNFFLHGWSVNPDNFLFSDLPLYSLLAVFVGQKQWLLYIVPYIFFLLFLFGCVLIIRMTGGTKLSRNLGSIAILLLLGLPFTSAQDMFLKSAIHSTTIMQTIYGMVFSLIIFKNCHFRILLSYTVGFVALLVCFSDPQPLIYFVLSFFCTFVLRQWLYPGNRDTEIRLVLLISIFGIVGTIMPIIISLHGGFRIAPSFSTGFISSIFELFQSLIAFLKAFLFLFEGNPVELSKFYAANIFVILHYVILLFVFILCAKIVIRMPRQPEEIMQQWLVMGAILLALVDITSVTFQARVADSPAGYPINAIRYTAPCYVFAVLAATIEAQRIFDLFEKLRTKSLLIIAALFFVIVDVSVVTQAFFKVANQPTFISALPQRNLAHWLADHNLDYGVGDYWTSQMVTALSNNQIIVDEVIVHKKIEPYRWVGDMADLDVGKAPEFVVFTPINDKFVPTNQNITVQNVTETYGKPKAIFYVDGFVVVKLVN